MLSWNLTETWITSKELKYEFMFLEEKGRYSLVRVSCTFTELQNIILLEGRLYFQNTKCLCQCRMKAVEIFLKVHDLSIDSLSTTSIFSTDDVQ